MNQSNCLEIQRPIQFNLTILASKWSIQILRELFSGDRRTHELLDVPQYCSDQPELIFSPAQKLPCSSAVFTINYGYLTGSDITGYFLLS